MRRNYLSRTATGAFLCVLFVSPPCLAEGWQTEAWEHHIKVTGSSPAEYSYQMYTLNTTDTTKPGVMFSCSTRFGLNVLYSFEGVDFIELLHGGKQRRLKSIPVRVWMGKQRRDLEDYLVRRKDKVLANRQAKQSAAAMRALLRDKAIRIKSFGYFDITLDLPSLDSSAAQFVEVCPVAADIAKSVKDARSD